MNAGNTNFLFVIVNLFFITILSACAPTVPLSQYNQLREDFKLCQGKNYPIMQENKRYKSVLEQKNKIITKLEIAQEHNINIIQKNNVDVMSNREKINHIEKVNLDQKNSIKRMKSLLESLDKDINSTSYMYHAKPELIGMLNEESINLKRYEGYINDNKSSNVFSKFFRNKNKSDINWDPQFIANKISKVQKRIKLLKYAVILQDNNSLNYKELMAHI